ncbi:TPA: mechanosensitive ion channel family protein [Burkholderia cenocepacia]|nr:mechanosensitive ion channel family protein [Burkholderia cenocepacia]HDR9813591.1 mechanosensitive ion channel family protein [Burkholderia cenocepacia]HDR9821226.1 mechanosensitive ion channel family protein [Burkholderia cenocepacia]HDR9830729.1 mechanosensitive ion channel family protein [Burkholderia cenocepacia]
MSIQRLSTYARRIALIALLQFAAIATASAFPAAASAPVASGVGAAAPAISLPDAIAQLKQMQAELDRIKQQTSTASNSKELDALDDSAQELSTDVAKLQSDLTPQRAQVQAQLDVLGPAPAEGAAPEAPAVAKQRAALDARKTQIDAALKQAADQKTSLTNLTEQFAKLHRSLLKNQLAFRSGSIFSAQFWLPLFHLSPDDRQRLEDFDDELFDMLRSSWAPGQRAITTVLLIAAFAAWLGGRRLIERGLAWIALNRLPPTRLRRSALALSTALSTFLATAIAIQILYLAVARHYELTPSLTDLWDQFAKLAATCALIAGLGRALLCTKHPSWRLPALADPVALAMKPFPSILAGLLLVSGTLESINRIVDTSLSVTLFGRGIVSLVVALTVGASLLRANRARSALAAAGEAPEQRSTLAGLIHAGVTLAIVASLIALLIGYITVARFITYELVWFEIVLCATYILIQLTRDASESLFSSSLSTGQQIKHLFALEDRHLDQARTVLSGFGTSLLMLIAAIALVTGGFGTTPGDLLDSAVAMIGSQRLQSLNIMPDRILNAVIGFAIGFYLLRSLRRWLDGEFMPALGMDTGMRVSLITLFTNVGYVLLVLMTLGLLGVRWNNLAWIVSALSVGIGFGLQEIVKNFVSGLILLTERPVKVGDMVSIAGVEGDIRRINVRATEIQLSDRSTVIVPNSQLISQNVRNVTMGNSTQGVATLVLTFPLNTDPEQVRDLLLDAYREHPAILDKPAPSVTFSQLAPDGITLSVTGYVSSPRIASSTKSDLLFQILKQLRAAGITLSSPQMLVVQNMPANEGPTPHES